MANMPFPTSGGSYRHENGQLILDEPTVRAVVSHETSDNAENVSEESDSPTPRRKRKKENEE